MADLPLAIREHPLSRVTPVIPHHFVQPGLTAPQILSILWAHGRLTLLIFLLGLCLTTLFLTRWPRTYTAVVTMMVNYEVNDPLNGKELPVGQVESYLATQIELMQTPEVALEVVDRLGLTTHQEYVDGYPGEETTLREWAAQRVSRNLVIYQGQMGSQIIYVTYAGDTASEAAKVANAIVDVYKEQDRIRSTGPPAERAKRYATQLADLKGRVDQAQKLVTDFHQRTGLIDEATKATVDAAVLASLEGHLLEAQTARNLAEVRKGGDASSSDQVLSSLQVQALKTQLASQEVRLGQLERVYTSVHPEIIEAKSQIEVTRRSLDAAIKSYATNANVGVAGAQRMEQSSQQAVDRQRAAMLASSQLHGEGAKYNLELESAQAMYKHALESYDQTLFSAGGLYSNVSVVSRATPPPKPSKPKMLTDGVLGIVLSLILAGSVPVIIELVHRRVRCRDDLERHHGIPVLMEFDRLPSRNRTWT